MPPLIYPFTKVDHELHRPIILVNIINPKNNASIKFRALLDTGADKCLFPKDICDLLGIDLTSTVNKPAAGIEGKPMPTWIHTFKIEVLDHSNHSVFWKSKEIEIGCVEHNNVHALLGWKDCMENFNIRFNYPTKRIIIELHK